MTKNEFPILEFDPDAQAVIMPDSEGLEMKVPPKVVFAFSGDILDTYAQARHAEIVGHFESITREYPVYVISYRGQQICLMQAPMGAPAAVQILEWLIAYGAREIICGGSCGALEDFEENVFLVPRRALRDEGTSYHYQPPARFIDIDIKARKAIEKALLNRGYAYREVTTWTTDAFFRETRARVAERLAEGCSVVDMECSALAACAAFRGVSLGQLFYTADSLAKPDQYDRRDWGKRSTETALDICLDAVLNL